MSYVLGIDLGTTYSCVAYVDEYGKPVVLKNSDGDHTTPSVVFIESETNIIVGAEAKRSVEVESDKTVQFIKRKIGKEMDSVFLNDIEYHAPEISSYILKKIVADANSELIQTGVISEGEEIKDVVITCPAYFGLNEKVATKTAGELAGLNVLDIINEPTAAAISYGVSGDDKNETVLVYDLGGGTFDITVMKIDGPNIDVICTGGDDQLGGKDWDEKVIEYVIERYQEENGEDLTEDPESIASLYIDVETWKKSLSTREKVNISVNGLGGRFREELTREKFEELTVDLLNRTKNLLDDILKTAEKKGYGLNQINKVLLVGGSSRMPQVSDMLEKDYNVTPVLADPDEAVAKGAAIYASNKKVFNNFLENEASQRGQSVDELKEMDIIDGELSKKFAMQRESGISTGININISNVLSRTYGIETLCDNEMKICNMLFINDKLPKTSVEHFGTVSDNQVAIDIKIFESRTEEKYMDVDDREPITNIKMNFTKPVPRGTGIIMNVSLDTAGILHIVAEEELYHSKLDTTFQLSNQMSEIDMHSAAIRMQSATIE